MVGYMNMEMQQYEKAKMYFEFSLEYYPYSVNAYDSMSEYYENQNDTASALKFLTKAYEISGDNNYKKRIELLKSKN
jgi:tetratricopeptide (TPR) repeat protein